MTFEELLSKCENQILTLKKDQYFLTTFENRILTLSKGKPFIVRNDIVYRMVFGQWDMLVINLGSFSKAMIGHGGFFKKITANLHLLKPIDKKSITPPKGRISSLNKVHTEEELKARQTEYDKHYIDHMFEAHRKELFKLFPNAEKRETLKITAKDIDDLTKRFELIVNDIRDDRDNHRAHRFENKKNNSAATKLSIKKIEEKFQELESLFNSLKLVFQNSTLMYSDMNHANAEQTADDLIDLIFWGSNRTLDNWCGINKKINSKETSHLTYGYLLRDQHLEEVHRIHEMILNGEISPEDYGLEHRKLDDICFNEVFIKENRY